MEEVFRMYAMSDGDLDGEPQNWTPTTTKISTTKTKKSKPPTCSLPQTTMRESWKRL